MTRERKMPDTVKILLATNKEQRKRLQAADALAEAAQGLIDLDKADGLWHIELQLALAAYRAGAADMAEGERRQVETLAGRQVNVKYEAHANLFQIRDARSCTVLTPENAAALRDELTRLLATALPVDPAPPPRWEDEAATWFEQVTDVVQPAARVPGPRREMLLKAVEITVAAASMLRRKGPTPSIAEAVLHLTGAAAPSPGPRWCCERFYYTSRPEHLAPPSHSPACANAPDTDRKGPAAASSGKRCVVCENETIDDSDYPEGHTCGRPGGAERAEPERCDVSYIDGGEGCPNPVPCAKHPGSRGPPERPRGGKGSAP